MKKLALLVVGFVIGALLTYYFCPREIEKMEIMQAAPPSGVISVAEATSLYKNWQKNNSVEIDSTLEVVGSRKKTTNVGWSLNVVKQYLDYAETTADSMGYDMTGISIFMGNYGQNSDPAKKNRNTLFIVPTGSKKLSKASMVNLSVQSSKILDIPPLNDSTGGQGNYP